MSAGRRVSLKIFDLNGRLIQSFPETEFGAGAHQPKWDATNIGVGIYVLRMKAGNYQETRKLAVTK